MTGDVVVSYATYMTTNDTTPELIIFPRGGEWMVEMVGDEECFAAFGTTVLPTAWTTRAPAEEVLQGLRRLNPGARVDWLDSYDEWHEQVITGDARLARMARL